RNTELLKAAFDLDLYVLGLKDACQAQLTLVYGASTILTRTIRGTFRTTSLGIVVDDPRASLKRTDVERIRSMVSSFCTRPPVFLYTDDRTRDSLMSIDAEHEVLPWNFREAGKHAPLGISTRKFKTVRNIGAPAPEGTGKYLGRLKQLASVYAQDGEWVISIRSPLPASLETGRTEADSVLGFPFVHKTREG